MARKFDGISDQISFPRPPQVDGATQLSVLFRWIQPGAVNNYAPVLSWLTAALHGFYVSHVEGIAGFIRVGIGNAVDGFKVAGYGGLTAGLPARCALLFDGSLAPTSRLAVWVNGVPAAYFVGDTSFPAFIGPSTSALTLGSAPPAVGAVYANIDSFSEVAIYTRILSAGEIAAHNVGYAPSVFSPQGRIFYAPLVRDVLDLHGAPATVTGTTVVDQPRTIYTRARSRIVPPPAVLVVPPTYVLPTVAGAYALSGVDALVAPLIARPSSTLSAGSWTPQPGGTLHGVTSDVDDATAAESSAGPASDTMDLGFPAMGTPKPGPVTFTIRHRLS